MNFYHIVALVFERRQQQLPNVIVSEGFLVTDAIIYERLPDNRYFPFCSNTSRIFVSVTETNS